MPGLSWSTSPYVDTHDWEVVRQMINQAAANLSSARIGPYSALEVMRDGKGGINKLLHDLIEKNLKGVPGNERYAPVTDDHHDVDVWGLPIELKTASSADIKSNKSYTKRDPSYRRLLIAVNFTVDKGQNVRPWLMRYGLIGPDDYTTFEKGQIAYLSEAGLRKLHAFWSAAVDDMPAIFIPGIGEKKLVQLGDPSTIGEALRVMRRSGDRGLARLADAVTPAAIIANSKWRTYGQRGPVIEKRLRP